MEHLLHLFGGGCGEHLLWPTLAATGAGFLLWFKTACSRLLLPLRDRRPSIVHTTKRIYLSTSKITKYWVCEDPDDYLSGMEYSTLRAATYAANLRSHCIVKVVFLFGGSSVVDDSPGGSGC